MEATNVRVDPETRVKLDELLAIVRVRGWVRLGTVHRDDNPTQSSVVAEAIRQLLARVKRKK